MNLIVIGTSLLASGAGLFLLFKFVRPSKKRALRAGDYVMFKGRYKQDFPHIPTTHALVLEKVVGDKGEVVFMTTSQILRETVPLDALVLAQ